MNKESEPGQDAPSLAATSPIQPPSASSMQEKSLWSWLFFNFLAFLYVRFVVFADTDRNYTSPLVLLFLIPLVLASCVGALNGLLSSAWKPLVLQSLLAAYTIWILVCFIMALSFPADEKLCAQLDSEIRQFDWQSLPKGPASPGLRTDNTTREGTLIIVDRDHVSPLFWQLPISRRATSLKTASTLILINISSVEHPDAVWIRVTPSGERIPGNKVLVSLWDVTVVDFRRGTSSNVQFRGDVAAVKHNLLGMPPQIEPTEPFLAHFKISKTKWTKFFYPEVSLFRALIFQGEW